MSFYLMAIAIADTYYSNRFSLYNRSWRTGVLCSVTASINFISWHVTSYTILIVTMNSYLSAKYHIPFSFRSAVIQCFLIWMFAIVLGMLRHFTYMDNYIPNAACIFVIQNFTNNFVLSLVALNLGISIILCFLQTLLFQINFTHDKTNYFTVDKESNLRKRVFDISVIQNLFLIVYSIPAFSEDFKLMSVLIIVPLSSVLIPTMYIFNVYIERRKTTQRIVLLKRLKAKLKAGGKKI